MKLLLKQFDRIKKALSQFVNELNSVLKSKYIYICKDFRVQSSTAFSKTFGKSTFCMKMIICHKVYNFLRQLIDMYFYSSKSLLPNINVGRTDFLTFIILRRSLSNEGKDVYLTNFIRMNLS